MGYRGPSCAIPYSALQVRSSVADLELLLPCMPVLHGLLWLLLGSQSFPYRRHPRSICSRIHLKPAHVRRSLPDSLHLSCQQREHTSYDRVLAVTFQRYASQPAGVQSVNARTEFT